MKKTKYLATVKCIVGLTDTDGQGEGVIGLAYFVITADSASTDKDVTRQFDCKDPNTKRISDSTAAKIIANLEQHGFAAAKFDDMGMDDYCVQKIPSK